MAAGSAAKKLQKDDRVVDIIGAIAGHLRVGDTEGHTVPLVPLVLAVGVLALRLATM